MIQLVFHYLQVLRQEFKDDVDIRWVIFESAQVEDCQKYLWQNLQLTLIPAKKVMDQDREQEKLLEEYWTKPWRKQSMAFLKKMLHLQRYNNDCEQESNIDNLSIIWNIHGKHI